MPKGAAAHQHVNDHALVAHIQGMGHMGLDQAQISGAHHGLLLVHLMDALALEHIEHLIKIMAVGHRGRVAVVLGDVDTHPPVRRKKDFLQVFRLHGLGPFRNDQGVLAHLIGIKLLKIAGEDGRRGFSQAVIAVKNFAVIECMQLVKQLLLFHAASRCNRILTQTVYRP